MRRRLALAAKVVPAVALAGAMAYGYRFAPVKAEGATADRGPVVVEAPGTGTLESAVLAAPGFPVPGRIASLDVDEGARVAAGQQLATLHADEAREQLGVSQAGARVAGAAIGRADAQLERARAAAARADADLQRVRRLFESGTVGAAELQAAEERRAVTSADVRSFEAARSEAEHTRAAAVRTVAREQARVGDLRVVSPIDGVVVRRHREVGDSVSPGVPVYTIAALDKTWIRAWVDETSLGALLVGQRARIVFRSHPGVDFAGRVDRIAKETDRQTHELTVDVQVHELPEPHAFGQKADVWIETARRPDAVRVPRGYCERHAGRCTVLRGGRVTDVPVAFGLVSRTHVEVTEGLQPGDVVLRSLAPSDRLEPGRRVQLLAAMQ